MHLTDWPTAADVPADAELAGSMDLARDVCSSVLRLRKANGRRVRQPLAELRVAVAGSDRLLPFTDLIADEVNVKHIELTDDVAAVARYELQVTPAALGPRLGKQTQQVIKAVKAGDWTREGDTRRRRRHRAAATASTRCAWSVDGDGASTPLGGPSGVVVLDTDVTPELAAEGTRA